MVAKDADWPDGAAGTFLLAGLEGCEGGICGVDVGALGLGAAAGSERGGDDEGGSEGEGEEELAEELHCCGGFGGLVVGLEVLRLLEEEDVD